MEQIPPYNFESSYPYFYEQPRRRRFRNLFSGNKPQVNVILFLLTILTTYLSYGAWYSLSIMSILLAHEMGHYLMCRKYGVRATLPFFIPFIPQLNPFGTMGAVIKMEARVPNRKALFDVGVAGPLAGLFFTIPSLIVGLKWSQVMPVSSYQGHAWVLGESLLFSQLSKLVIPDIPQDWDIFLHPLAFAGWAGLFVTALNLLPIGQLDGGHIVYALFGRHSKYVFGAAIGAFAINTVFYPGWVLLLILLIWFGYKHPPPTDDITPLDLKRRILGVVTFIIFLLSFTPVPFKF
ncbi:MAG: site-2 protease family protein [candidate division KSB1 bacterium]|nr:site-2 protease family protein [candidate division KSB1 bacterium]